MSDVFFRDLGLPDAGHQPGRRLRHPGRPDRGAHGRAGADASSSSDRRSSSSTATSTRPWPRRWSRRSSASRSRTSRPGLRSFDDTMPEEINRRVTDLLRDLLFVTSPEGVDNLDREGVPADRHPLRRQPDDRHAAGATSTGSTPTRMRARARTCPARTPSRRCTGPATWTTRPRPARIVDDAATAWPSCCRSSCRSTRAAGPRWRPPACVDERPAAHRRAARATSTSCRSSVARPSSSPTRAASRRRRPCSACPA